MLNKLKATFATFTAASVSATGVVAGGLSDQIVEAPVVEEVVTAPAESSVPSWVIPVVILGVIIAAASSSDSECDPEEKGCNSGTSGNVDVF
ncbi:MAG: hypothetical protein AAFU41_00365 [Pseudomonadota bacterium]